MRWSPPRSLAVALGIALGAVPWTAPPQLHGQNPPPSATPAPDADLAKRVEKLDGAINQREDAGQFAEAVPLGGRSSTSSHAPGARTTGRPATPAGNSRPSSGSSASHERSRIAM